MEVRGLSALDGEDLAFATHLHFADPALLCFAVADGSVDQPTKLSGTEFPRRTIPPAFDGTVFDGPTRAFTIHAGALQGQ